MTNVVDTSAFLAFMKREAVRDDIAERIDGALICAVNFAEIVAVALRQRLPLDRVRTLIALTNLRVIAFDAPLAETAGALIAQTRDHGLSLGDCACLALAQRENLPVLTADRAWRNLDVGVEMTFVR